MMPTTAVKTCRFRITLAGIPSPEPGLDDEAWDARMAELLDELTGRVLAAGLDDTGLGSCGEVFSLDFEREAGSLAEAVGAAIADVERAGLAVANIEVMP